MDGKPLSPPQEKSVSGKPDVNVSKRQVLALIKQFNIDPNTIIQIGDLAEQAIKDKTLYPVLKQNAIRSGMMDESDFGKKDKAENVMIVDLMRNDFGKICESGSVEVPRLLASEDHPGLRHLVSDIEGVVRKDISWEEILESLSPPGSISGAPKSSAISVITEHEEKRGPYCGALGWVQGDQCELSVAIRIFWQDSQIHFGTGAGITWGSDPVSEWEETQLKARRLISIAGGVLS